MPRWPRLRFKSITHRLIFACAIAAIAIYSLSFWQMRQVVEQGVVYWMLEVAEARLSAVANEINGILGSIEQNAEMVALAVEKIPNTSNEATLPFLQTLVAQNWSVAAVAITGRPVVDWKSAPLGLYPDRQVGYRKMSDRDVTRLLSHCQDNLTATQPFWTKPYPNPSYRGSLDISYCNPLRQTPGGMLAIKLGLDLSKLVDNRLQIIEKFELYGQKMGQPLLLSLPTKQWLLSPSKSVQNWSWFSAEHSHILNSPLPPETLRDSQGILISTALPSTSLVLGIAFPAAELRWFQQKYLWLVIVSMVKDMVLMCVAIAIVSQQTTRSLRSLIGSTEDIAQGNLDTVLPVIHQRDEVGRLSQAFRHMRDALKDRIQELKVTTAAKQAMESELEIAGQIQRSMVPRIEVTDGPNPRYQLSALLQPARQVGGDLYDFFLLEGDRLCLVVGDVADKGMPAALLMARTITLIRTIAHQTKTPTEMLAAVNRELCTDNEECLFVTLFCGFLDLKTGKLNYASSGHDPALLLRDRQVQFLDLETGPPLGIEEEAIFCLHECWLHDNDLILLYTDGITEAMNLQGELFSEARLLDAIAYYPLSTPARTIRTIQHFHQQFIENASQSDDITLLALQYRPSSPFPQEVKIVEQTISINSQLTELERVKPYIGEILQAEGLPVESIEDAQLIVEEVLVNIIEYGYGDRDNCDIELKIKISAEAVIMTFEDSGQPFNPLDEIEPPDLLSMDDDRRSLGGLGFYLVRELAARIDYIYAEGKNILTVLINS